MGEGGIRSRDINFCRHPVVAQARFLELGYVAPKAKRAHALMKETQAQGRSTSNVDDAVRFVRFTLPLDANTKAACSEFQGKGVDCGDRSEALSRRVYLYGEIPVFLLNKATQLYGY